MSLKSKLSLFAVVATALVLFPALAFAQGVTQAASNQFDANSWLTAASGFAIGIAALGGTMGACGLGYCTDVASWSGFSFSRSFDHNGSGSL